MNLSRFSNPFSSKRDAARRMAELRQRDGDQCRRCRRPLRFDLPDGHDLGAMIIRLAGDDLADQCLTHRRCHTAGADHTSEVAERRKRKNEAALFAKPRKRAKRAA